MKYYPVELESLFSCKQMFEKTDVRGDDLSVCDSRFHFESRVKKFSNVPFQMFGIEAKLDNLICDGQEIIMPVFSAQKLYILGFAEYSNFKEKLILRDVDITEKKVNFTIYGISQNMETLYESELDCNTMIAFQSRGKFSQRMKYSIASIAIEKPIKSVILPRNSEIHIAAITLCK